MKSFLLRNVCWGKGAELGAQYLPGGAFHEGTLGGRAWRSSGGVVGYDLVAALAFGAEHARIGEREEVSGVIAIVGEAGEANADGDLYLKGTIRNFDAGVGDALTKGFEFLAS
jgi:hypothetical protein